MATNQLATVEAFLKGHPTIKFIPPSSKESAAACDIWNGSRPDQPLAVVQPQSSQDVATLIKFLKSNANIPFSIRSGGNNLESLALVQDALLIDLRGLNSVVVAADRKSATVGGGILQGDMVEKLWKEGQLVAATGTIPHVGFFGWASYGGYGPFSSHWGLGVDQIIAATVVNPSGDIIQLQGDDDPLLGGIRGAGGVFGVVVDLTIKVYPAPYLLAGPIVFDTTTIAKTYSDVNNAYNKLLEQETLPQQLTLQRVTFLSPRGLTFAFLFAWSGSGDVNDIEEGKRWSEKIASLGPTKMNMVKPITIPEWISGAGAHVPRKVFGSSWTHSISCVSPEVADVIGRHIAQIPLDAGAGIMFSLHQVRGPSAKEQNHSSVFTPRQPHFLLEILGYSATSNDQTQSLAEDWGKRFSDEVERAASASGVLLPTSYVSVYNSTRASSATEWVQKVYGDKAEELRKLKASFDPENLFQMTVPSLE